MRIVILLTYLFSFGNLNAQTLSDFGEIPEPIDESTATSEFLTLLNWESINEFCKRNDGFYSYEREKGLLTEFEYVKQGRVESFEIVSYKGKVLEFYFDVPEAQKQNEYFFDKGLWLEYVNEVIPDLPDSLMLTEDEPTELLKGF